MPNVYLVGFMAAGKTTVGRLLAERLGLPFVDVDDKVTELAGMSVARLFEQEGEAQFRRLEAEALRDLAVDSTERVVATGGGAPCHHDSMNTMLSTGLVLCLAASLETSLERAGDPASRPLLRTSGDAITELYAERMPIYRRAHAVVATDQRGPDQVAQACHRVIDMARRSSAAIPTGAFVALGERTYPVIVEGGARSRIGELTRVHLPPRTRRVAVVADDNVDPLYGGPVAESLAAAGFEVVRACIPAGEPSKSIERYHALCEQLVELGLDRSSAVVAVGGGVVGDLAGFAAATLYRGIPVVHVATTLLAMVDSAIGGKTGINLTAGKNLVGSIWQPHLVVSDPEVLVTLPGRERRAAIGELVKYALLDGEELLDVVERLAPELGAEHMNEPPAELSALIRASAAIKCAIVAADERELRGERALLNLGHTIGHAIEAEAGYGVIAHGEAVGLGLLAACRVSARVAGCDPALEHRVARTLAAGNLSIDVSSWLRAEVLDRVGVDKKRTGSRIGFVVVEKPGRVRTEPIEKDQLIEILAGTSGL